MNQTHKIKSRLFKKKKRFNQTSIAQKVGVDQSYISKILNGSKKASPELFKKIQNAISQLEKE